MLQALAAALLLAAPPGRGTDSVVAFVDVTVIPMDRERQWYRYHQLFADVLHARLRDELLANVRSAYRKSDIRDSLVHHRLLPLTMSGADALIDFVGSQRHTGEDMLPRV